MVADATGKFLTRNLNTLNLSPWAIGSNDINYGGSIGIGTTDAVSEALDIGAGTIRVRNLATSTTENTLLVADGNGRFKTREASTLNLSPWTANSNELAYDGNIGLGLEEAATETLDIGTGTIRIRDLSTTTTEDQLLVVDASGNFMKRNTSTLNLSPWTEGMSVLMYNGYVGLGLGGDVPSQSLDASGTARLRGLASNTLTDEILVADASGVVHKRNFDTFSPWTLDADNSYYSNERIGIGGANPDGDISTSILATVPIGLNVNNTNISSDAYGIRSEVYDDDVKAIGVVNRITGDDVFRVFGNGIVEAKEVLVSLDIWNDHVFYPTYDLMPLEKVESFVNENHHLPEVPSEKEVLENGVNVGEMEALLLKKVEELTLYIIEQNKQLKVQAEKIEALEEKLK